MRPLRSFPPGWLPLCAAAALAAACELPDSPYFGHVRPVSDPRHLRYCNQGEPEELDPTMATTTVAVRLVHQLFDGLMVHDLEGKPVPSLARELRVSSDSRTFSFTLRPEARWSSGRRLDAYDVGYQVVRVLHPSTASGNASNLPTLKGASGFGERRLAVLTEAAGPYPAGQVVELVAIDGKPFDEWKSAAERPNPNRRRAAAELALRDLGAPVGAAYAWVPAGAEVEVVAESGTRVFPQAPDGAAWSYVFDAREGGVYGWVPSAEVRTRTFAASRFAVRRVSLRDTPGVRYLSAEELAADEQRQRPVVEVGGLALVLSPEVLGVHVHSRDQISLETSFPTPYFPHLAANRALRPTPIEVVSRRPRRWAEPGTIVTSGPMHLARWLERDRVELVRSPSYWNQAEYGVDRITAYSLDDATAAANLYYSGRCDAVATNQVPGTYLPILRGERRGKRAYRDFHVRPFLSSYFVLLNHEKLKNVHLRRALGLAIDRRPIPGFTHGGEHPTAQLTPGAALSTLSPAERALCGVSSDSRGVAMIMVPGELCYVPPPGLDYDPARAAEELAQARRELGAAFPAKLTYRYNAGSEVHKLIAEYLQEQWRQVGLHVELEVQEWRTLVADTSAGNYELARFGNAATFPNPETEYLALFECGASFNRTRYCNPEFDRRLRELRTLADPVERNRKVYEAEKLVVEDAVVIPLYVYTQRHLQKPYVRDLAMNLVDQPPLHRAWLDPAWAEPSRRGSAP